MTKPAQAASEVEARVREGIAVFNRGDYEAALAYFHPEVVVDSSAAFVVHGPYRGIEGVREFYDTIAEAFAEFRVEPQEVIVRGDRALVVARTVGLTHDGEPFEGEEFDLWTIRDGLAIGLEIFFDREEAEGALRAGPEAPQAV